MFYGNKKIIDVNYGGIPIKKAYYGSQLVWEKVENGIFEAGHEGIDLGLPSGLIWATEYYIPYVNFDLSKAASLLSASTIITYPPDLWGGRWRLPTAEEIIELLNNTTAGISNINKRYYTTLTANNGRSIMLPHYGYLNDNFGVINPVEQNSGYYWSSTEKNEDDGYRLYLSPTDISSNNIGSGDKNLYRTAWMVFNPKD